MEGSRSVVVDTTKSPNAKLRPVPISTVKMEDGFWEPRLRLMRDVTLPSQYDIIEETGRLDNFRRASGKIEGDFKGAYFNDSDVYKWLEGVCLALAYHRDPNLESLADKTIAEIAAAQDEDGYLDTFFTFERKEERWENLRDMHELYCAGHLFHAAVAHHRATGKRTLLNVAVRLADHLCSVFGPEGRPGTPGHPEPEMALVELYRETGEIRYLELARFFLDQRGRGVIGGSPYHIDHRPFRELEEVVGHAVRSLYLNGGATDIYMETGDETVMAALERLWRNMAERRMYVTGGVGARHSGEAFGDDYELPNLRAYAETCAAVANVFWNWRMLLAKAEARFADLVELALYNGALSGISLDGKGYFYVNPLSDRGRTRRQPWFDCACCPTNIVRLIGYVPGYIYTTSEEGIWVHLYASNTAEVVLKGKKIRITQRTDYPWEGDVEVRIEPEDEEEFSLFLRIPGWCEGADISVGGEVASGVGPGYFEVRRRWRKGDRVELSMPMRPELLTSHPWVESNTGKVAIRRGPIVYCLEQADNPAADVWDIEVNPDAPLRAEFRSDLLGGVVVVEGEAMARDTGVWKGKLYQPLKAASASRRPAKFVAIPYYAWANREPGPMAVWVKAWPPR